MAKVVHFEIGGTDKAKAAGFYGALFGWTFSETGPATLIEGAGLTGHLNDLGHESHNYVVVYVDVEDIEAAVQHAAELGGKTLVGPVAIPSGKIAWIQDPTGTTIGLWERARHGTMGSDGTA